MSKIVQVKSSLTEDHGKNWTWYWLQGQPCSLCAALKPMSSRTYHGNRRNYTKHYETMHLGRCIIFDLSKGEDKGLPRSQLCRLQHRPFFICPFFPQKKSHNLNTSQHFLRCLLRTPCLPWTIKPEGAKRIESLQALSAVAEANQNCRPGARFPSRSCKATKKIVLSENCKILLARART